MWPLIGIAIVVIGFSLRFNAMLVVTVAGIVTGLVAGISPYDIVAKFGQAFADNRYLAIAWMTLPVIGMLESVGLRERAQTLIGRIKAATTGRVLLMYLIIRKVCSALGLTSLGGHAQMVRPLIAPMAEGAARTRYGNLPDETSQLIRANALAVDNIGVFFGEDVFIAIGSILLMKGFLDQSGIVLEPMSYALWAIPTAIAAFIIHGIRLFLLDRRLKKTLATGGAQ